MDEAGARALMERLSATEPPPSRVDIGLARQRGRTLARRRRWVLAGAPLLAAAAVVAVVVRAGWWGVGGGGWAARVGPRALAALPPWIARPALPRYVTPSL